MSEDHWLPEPKQDDLSAAENYLSLLLPASALRRVVAALHEAKPSSFLAKDLLRASGLPLLAADNVEVHEHIMELKNSKAISPVLLVRGRLERGVTLTVADGYHRICASYHVNEEEQVVCRIADLE